MRQGTPVSTLRKGACRGGRGSAWPESEEPCCYGGPAELPQAGRKRSEPGLDTRSQTLAVAGRESRCQPVEGAVQRQVCAVIHHLSIVDSAAVPTDRGASVGAKGRTGAKLRPSYLLDFVQVLQPGREAGQSGRGASRPVRSRSGLSAIF